jgi:hypothetical protein
MGVVVLVAFFARLVRDGGAAGERQQASKQ